MSLVKAVRVTAIVCVLAAAARQSYSQTLLPLARAYGYANADAYCEAVVKTYSGWYPIVIDWDSDYLDGSDADTVSALITDASAEDPSYPANYAESSSTAAAAVEGPLEIDPYDAAVHIQARLVGTAGAGAADGYRRCETGFYADARADNTLEVLNDPEDEELGTDESSATLSGYILIQVINSAMDTYNPTYGGDSPYLTAYVQSSYLTAESMDPYNSEWVVEGVLSQATSSDPYASPTYVSEFRYDYEIADGIFYNMTEPTQVGATIETYAELGIQAYHFYADNSVYDTVDVDIFYQIATSFNVSVP